MRYHRRRGGCPHPPAGRNVSTLSAVSDYINARHSAAGASPRPTVSDVINARHSRDDVGIVPY